MDEKKLGPLLSDEQFFGECLNLDYPGMEAVKETVADKDYSLAKKGNGILYSQNIRCRSFL